MITILISLIIAWLFYFIAYGIYGLQGVMSLVWIDQVFIGIIVTGLLLAAINMFWQYWPCQLSEKLHITQLKKWFCH